MIKELLEWYKEYQESRITADELKKHCHYWSAKNCLEELRYVPLPAEPYKITEWRHMTPKAREHAPLEVITEMNKLMSGFTEHRNRIRWTNYANMDWLKSMLKTFQKYKCEDNIRKVQDKLWTHLKVKGVGAEVSGSGPATSAEVAGVDEGANNVPGGSSCSR